MPAPYVPMFALTRGTTVESIHFGAAAVVDSTGRLVASVGDPQAVTFLRSSAKPFQALPFIERGGDSRFKMTPREVSLICASHIGTDDHAAAVRGLQAKIGVSEDDLMCGVHYPIHEATADAMKVRGEQPTACRHNCSGKHTGMLAHARLRDLTTADYVDSRHPIQQSILAAFAEMCGLPVDKVELGIDGCSAPNFAVPLYNAALAFARLCDPRGLAPERADACRRITTAMTSHPDMVAGPGRFDTRLMETGQGRIVVKGGAEGYQALGLLPEGADSDSPGLGLVIKISDGDPSGRARQAVALAILQLLEVLSDGQLAELAGFGPQVELYNFRKLRVGAGQPVFVLER